MLIVTLIALCIAIFVIVMLMVFSKTRRMLFMTKGGSDPPNNGRHDDTLVQTQPELQRLSPVDEHSNESEGPPPQYEPGKFTPNGQVTLISTSNEVAAEIIQQQTGNEVLTVSELRKSPVKRTRSQRISTQETERRKTDIMREESWDDVESLGNVL